MRSDIGEDIQLQIDVQTELVEIPFVYRYNLPEAAQRIFRSVYNETLRCDGAQNRDDAIARQRAIAAVKERFVRDSLGTWRSKESHRAG